MRTCRERELCILGVLFYFDHSNQTMTLITRVKFGMKARYKRYLYILREEHFLYELQTWQRCET